MYANKHYITGVYITINELQVSNFGNAGFKNETYKEIVFFDIKI